MRDLTGRFYADLWNRWNDAAVEEVLAGDFSFRGSMGTAGPSEVLQRE
jgi:hypothetical protein